MDHANRMVLMRARNGMLYMGFRKLKCEAEGYKRTEECFTCERCSATFSGEAYMKLHVQEHGSSPRLMCAFCMEPFTQLHQLRSHVKQCTQASVSRALELSLKLGGKRHAELEAALAAAPNLDLDAQYFTILSSSTNSKTLTTTRRQRRARSSQKRTRKTGAGSSLDKKDLEEVSATGESPSTPLSPQIWRGLLRRTCSTSSEAYRAALEAETSEAVNTLLAIMREQDERFGYEKAPGTDPEAFDYSI